MSLIGTLEHFKLTTILQRLESHGKTGLLTVKQGNYWVEFYFRDGRLLCIGPVRTRATLGERLVQDKIISANNLQEVRQILGDDVRSETKVAIALMERGFVTRDSLRAWNIQKTSDVVGVVLYWNAGEVYFEDDTPPPADRLLVSMSISSIIESLPPPPAPPAPPVQVSPAAPPPRQAATSPLTPNMPASQSGALPRQAAPNRPSMATPASPFRSGIVRLSARHSEMKPAAPMAPSTPKPDIARVPTLMGAAQFMSKEPMKEPAVEPVVPKAPETPSSPISAASLIDAFPIDSLPATESLSPIFSQQESSEVSFADSAINSDISFAGLTMDSPEESSVTPSVVAVPVMHPVAPKRIDVSYMLPEMVIVPADLAAYREQNPHIQITPDQWRILLFADGQTSLQMVCQYLSAPAEIVCQIAGELVAEGLVHVVLPQQMPSQELSPAIQDVGLNNGYVAPGYAASQASPWSVASEEGVMPGASAFPFETESQWGNGRNGATFIPGRGWITSPQPLQPLQPDNPIQSGVYAPANGMGY